MKKKAVTRYGTKRSRVLLADVLDRDLVAHELHEHLEEVVEAARHEALLADREHEDDEEHDEASHIITTCFVGVMSSDAEDERAGRLVRDGICTASRTPR